MNQKRSFQIPANWDKNFWRTFIKAVLGSDNLALIPSGCFIFFWCWQLIAAHWNPTSTYYSSLPSKRYSCDARVKNMAFNSAVFSTQGPPSTLQKGTNLSKILPLICQQESFLLNLFIFLPLGASYLNKAQSLLPHALSLLLPLSCHCFYSDPSQKIASSIPHRFYYTKRR